MSWWHVLLLFAPADSSLAAGQKAFDRAAYEEAIRLWEQADPHDCSVPFYIGLANYRLHRLTEAMIRFRVAMQCAPTDIRPKIALAEATAAVGDLKRALFLYEEILKISPKSVETLQGAAAITVSLQENDKAISLLERLVQVVPTQANLHAQLGAAYAATGNMSAAERAFEMALRLDDKHSSALTGLGNIYLKTNRTEQALLTLQNASSAGNAFEPYYLLGSAYGSVGQYENALKALERAKQLDPNQPEVYYQLAMTFAHLNRDEERQQALLRFRELKKQTQLAGDASHKAEQLLQESRPLIDAGNLLPALRLLQQANGLQPQRADVLFQIASIQYDLQQYKEAQLAVRKAIAGIPDDWSYHLLLGLVEKAMAHPSEARKSFETAIQLNGEAADAYNQLGDLAMRESRFSDAVENFRSAIKISPHEEAFQANLVAAQQAAGSIRQ